MPPPTEKRIVAVLLRLSGHRFAHPASPPLAFIAITQSELAVATSLSRSSAGSILRKLSLSGEIKIDYGTMVIRDAKALARRFT